MLKSWLIGSSLTSRALPLVMFAADRGSGSGGTGGGNTGDTDPPVDDNDDDADDEESEDDHDDDSDDDDDDDTDTSSQSSKDKVTLEQKIKSGFANLVDKYGGNPRAAGEQLFRERFLQREAQRALRRENQQLREQLPGKGRVVLPQSQVNELREYRALGAVKDLKTVRARVTQLETDLAARQRDDTLRDVARITGYNMTVLKDVGGNLSYETKTETVDGKTTETAYIVDGTKRTKVEDHAAAKWAHHLPSLTAKTTSGGSSGGTQGSGSDRTRSAGGTRKLASQAGATGSTRNTNNGKPQGVASRVTSRYSVPGQKQE